MIIKGLTDLTLASEIALAIDEYLDEQGIIISDRKLDDIGEVIYYKIMEKVKWSEDYIANKE